MALPLVGGLLAAEALIAAAETVLVAMGIISGVALTEKLIEVEKKKKELSNQAPGSTQACAQATNNAKPFENVSDDELKSKVKELDNDIKGMQDFNDLISEDRELIAEKEKEIELIEKEIKKRKNQAEAFEKIKNSKSQGSVNQKPKPAQVKPKQPEISKPKIDNKPKEVESDLTKTQIRGEKNKFHQIERDSNGEIIDIKSSRTPFKPKP